MRTIKGVYENGEIKLLEKWPDLGIKNVLITFIDEDEEEEISVRKITLQSSPKQLGKYLNDEREDLYQDYLK